MKILKIFFQQILLLCVLSKLAECSPYGENCKLTFLSDKSSKVFFEKFLTERDSTDFAAWIKIDVDPQEVSNVFDGIILHQKGNFIFEVNSDGVDTKKFFISSENKKWTNSNEQAKFNQPIVNGSLFSIDEFLMLFACHEYSEYCGPKKVCGRVTQQFICPFNCENIKNNVKYARLSIDSSLYQVLQVEYLDENKKLIKYQKVASLKKHNNWWMPKVIEFFDIKSRKSVEVEILDIESGEMLNSFFFSEKFLSTHSFF